VRCSSIPKALFEQWIRLLMMNERAHIQADVDVRIALIDGCLEGDLKTGHRVILKRNARVEGTFIRPR
jgi:cytoskeletal protein CcmA (bactofilin family)